jgi:hypothetical protein
MDKVYESGHLKVCVCVDCFSGFYIPIGAWDVVARKKGRHTPEVHDDPQGDRG